ncbi:MAG: ParA family protein [Myxococcales bacterium]|nr:ParA family protein [Myxococcales bacterium]
MTARDAAEFSKTSVQAIHQILKKQHLPFEKSQNRVYFGHETARAIFNLPFKFQVITFQIVKGGTGKTSTACNFAIRANLYGARVLCVDLDHQGNMTDFFGVDAYSHPVMVDVLAGDAQFKDGIINILPGLDLFSSRIDNSVLDTELMLRKTNLKKVYRDLFLSVKKDYDLIVVDCPPSLGHSVAAAALASDLIVTPVNPDKFAIKGVELSYQEVQDVAEQNDVKIDIAILFNKFDKRTSLSHETLENLITHPQFGKRLFSTYISVSQEFPNAANKSVTVFDSLRENPAKLDIDLFVREALELDRLKMNQKKSKSAEKKAKKSTNSKYLSA